MKSQLNILFGATRKTELEYRFQSVASDSQYEDAVSQGAVSLGLSHSFADDDLALPPVSRSADPLVRDSSAYRGQVEIWMRAHLLRISRRLNDFMKEYEEQEEKYLTELERARTAHDVLVKTLPNLTVPAAIQPRRTRLGTSGTTSRAVASTPLAARPTQRATRGV
jgi:hypothetical protein